MIEVRFRAFQIRFFYRDNSPSTTHDPGSSFGHSSLEKLVTFVESCVNSYAVKRKNRPCAPAARQREVVIVFHLRVPYRQCHVIASKLLRFYIGGAFVQLAKLLIEFANAANREWASDQKNDP